MKNVSIISAIFLLVITGCGGRKQTSDESNGFITVDVTASYPKKELILQDFMEVSTFRWKQAANFIVRV